MQLPTFIKNATAPSGVLIFISIQDTMKEYKY